MKRAVCKVLAFLLSGAIVNVAVAVGLTLRHPPGWLFGLSWKSSSPPQADVEAPKAWMVTASERFGSTDYATCTDVAVKRFSASASRWEDGAVCKSPIEADRQVLPAWSFAARASLDIARERPFMNVDEAARGWPMVCFRYEIQSDLVRSPGQTHASGVIGAVGGRPIPGQPIWGGLAVNTVLYAAGLWMVLAMPRDARTWWRVRNSRCGHCAYPVGMSAVCTECGKPVKPMSAEAVA